MNKITYKLNTMKETIQFRVTEEDKKYLQDEANRLKITLSSYVRMVVMSKNQKPI